VEEAEWRLVRRHPEVGERTVASVGSLAHLAPAVRAEHERWDGKGYPDGLSGEEIPLASWIVLACDAYHAMTSDRPYREAMGREAAMEELERNAGAQFCPRTVAALLGVIREKKSSPEKP
jgi:HD-GYP domain-containing protein (c-di-GMP phosphodiesterase class II)